MSNIRIVIANGTMQKYLRGGGALWSFFLQFLLGLKDLGHDVLLLEIMWSTGNKHHDEERITSFFNILRQYGLSHQCALVLFDKNVKEQDLRHAISYGKNKDSLRRFIEDTDLLWNPFYSLRQPLLGMFKRRVLIDGDPGHFHISALTFDMGIQDHHAFLTIGRKINDYDCEIPTLGVQWKPFTPFVYLPMWKTSPDPGQDKPFSAITHWEWGELWWKDRVYSISKRDGFLKYLDLPQLINRSFELAALIPPEKDKIGDRDVIRNHGWNLVDPWKVAGTISEYQQYIKESRAEIMCPKPIFKDLRTGWFSDRSVCYLASGRPVLAEDTGFSDYLPTGKGLLAFRDKDEAIEGVRKIDSDYMTHMKAARQIAEEYFDSRKCLTKMLADSFMATE